MSISKRVTEAFGKMVAEDPEAALFQICAAIEETSKREGRPKGKKGYKEFLSENIPIITAIGIGPALAGLKIGCCHPELPKSEDGASSLEDIVYHVMRCSLYHSASLPDKVRITDNEIGSNEHGILLIPKAIIAGLIIAVVASPENIGEHTQEGYFFENKKQGRRFYLEQLWGKRDELVKQLESLWPPS